MKNYVCYVCGFVFDPHYARVVLVEKQRPEWQRGRLNGCGGKVEEGETFLEAMERECKEETDLSDVKWRHLVTTFGPSHRVAFFSGVHLAVDLARTVTDERVRILPASSMDTYRTTAHVKWLVPLCMNVDSQLDGFRIRTPIEIVEEPGS